MFLHITGVKILSYLEYGFCCSNSIVGDSVARAIAAKVSIKILIHRSCKVLWGYDFGGHTREHMMIMKIAPMLITN